MCSGFEADGADAAAAVDRILALVRDGFGELDAPRETRPTRQNRSSTRSSHHPIGVSPGRVVGPALVLPASVAEPDQTIRISEEERPAAIERLTNAAAEVADQLRHPVTAAGTVGELLKATAAMATDPEVLADASSRVRERGLSPERAVWEAFGQPPTPCALPDPARRYGCQTSTTYATASFLRSSGRAAPGVPDPGHPLHIARR